MLFVKRSPSKASEGYAVADPEACDEGSLQLVPGAHSAVHVSHGEARSRFSFLRHKTRSLFLASLEIGLYAGVGALFHAWGLSQIPAVTSAFLIQTTTVFTPCISYLAGEHISRRVWLATAAAALGTVFIFVDGLLAAQSNTAVLNGSVLGKISVLTASAMYSMGTMRISQVASGVLWSMVATSNMPVFD